MDPMMDDDRPRLEGLIPPRRLGLLLLGLRQARGDSLDAAGIRTRGVVSPDRLLALETGESAPTDAELDALAEAYAFALTDLVPQRVELMLDYDERLIDAGGGFAAVVPEGTTLEEVLQRYLILVWALRGRQPGSYLQLRELDLQVLGDGLDVGTAAVVGMLAELLDDQAWVSPYRHPSQYGRPRFATVVPDAGIMLCGGHGGALVFRPDRSAPPEPVAPEAHIAQPPATVEPVGYTPLAPANSEPEPDITYEPAAYEPASYEPASYEPAAYEPAAYEPAAYEPAAYEPASYEPASYEPASYEPAAYEPASYEPASYEPAAPAVLPPVAATDWRSYETSPDPEPVAEAPSPSAYQPLFPAAPASATTPTKRTLPTLGTGAGDQDPFADLRRAFAEADNTPAPAPVVEPELAPESTQRGADLASWFDRTATPAVIVEEEPSAAAAFLSSLTPRPAEPSPAEPEFARSGFDDFGGMELRWGAALEEPQQQAPPSDWRSSDHQPLVSEPLAVAESLSAANPFAHLYASDDASVDPTPTIPQPLVPQGLPYAVPEEETALPTAAPAPWDPQGSPRLLRKLFPGKA